ncbi:BTAD domain-containing putative transcriptional regulator [Streptomyces sp. TRM49041]|uniref:BTAD domain-containing putative transcriptional regulator n=1 Tax=Streptomyces sp. TRM49041 TaxID=2603216 RepID=UPI0011EF169E|nr:BTAD domain-containing putative transcriptional regulator [Streptomyces sp. TRM49041]
MMLKQGEARSFGERLRSFRGRAGLTQRQLAEKSGVSVRVLRDLENGRVRRPQTRTVRRLADLLGLDVDEARELAVPQRKPAARPFDARLHIGVLGTLSVEYGGVGREVRAPKVRRLLALLALHHPEPAGLGEITRTLWPEEPPRSYQNLIHTYVSQVRRLLQPPGSGQGAATASSHLARTHTGYMLSIDRDQLDLTRFQDLSARARQAHYAGDTAAAHELAGLACRCWRGPLLADVPLLTQHPAATAAARQRVESLLLYADLAMRLRQPEQVVQALHTATGEEPLHEGLQARLMLALASCGEQSRALKVFAEVTRRLDRELGIQPGEELRRAHLRVLHQELPWPRQGQSTRPKAAGPQAIPVERPAFMERAGTTGRAATTEQAALVEPSARVVPSPAARPSQMPAEPTDYVGRTAELERLDRLLLAPGERGGQVPAALITGLPGVGKTALALHWAHRVRGRFPDGQLYVDLHGHALRRPLRAWEALASFLRALGVPHGQIPDNPDEAANLYRTRLSGRRVLIVLDNAREESQIRPLLPGDSGCAVLITSRNTLSGLVAREGVLRVGLDVLGQDEALALLARLLGQRRIEAEPLAAMALGRHCGGLPLAIRIVAARLAEYPRISVTQYCVELQGTGLFREPRADGDDLFASVQASFALSYAALPGPTRRYFRLLGRMEGRNISAYTVADLAGTAPPEAMRELRRLVDASLLLESAPGRFTVPDPLLRYAAALAKDDDTEHLQTIGGGQSCGGGAEVIRRGPGGTRTLRRRRP